MINNLVTIMWLPIGPIIYYSGKSSFPIQWENLRFRSINIMPATLHINNCNVGTPSQIHHRPYEIYGRRNIDVTSPGIYPLMIMPWMTCTMRWKENAMNTATQASLAYSPWHKTYAVTAKRTSSSSNTATQNALVFILARLSISLRNFGNLSDNDSLFFSIHRCWNRISSRSWITNAKGNGSTSNNTVKPLIAFFFVVLWYPMWVKLMCCVLRWNGAFSISFVKDFVCIYFSSTHL